MIAYHVVTDSPLRAGQIVAFDAQHRSGVYLRVHEKLNLVRDIYSCPEKYRDHPFGHHTAVALRELALEEVRADFYPDYPSRMECLYASETLEEAEKWADFFLKIGRPTYSIAKIESLGRVFAGDAAKCFEGRIDRKENLRLAHLYWETDTDDVKELLIGDRARILEIVKSFQ